MMSPILQKLRSLVARRRFTSFTRSSVLGGEGYSFLADATAAGVIVLGAYPYIRYRVNQFVEEMNIYAKEMEKMAMEVREISMEVRKLNTVLLSHDDSL